MLMPQAMGVSSEQQRGQRKTEGRETKGQVGLLHDIAGWFHQLRK
jgi:hypothetical protein